MGLFKDLRNASKMGRDQLDALDVKAQLAETQRRLDALAPTPAPAGIGIVAQATVVAARDTGTLVNHQSVVEVDLLVLLPTGVPVQVTSTVAVTPLHAYRLQPGRQVDVRLDPADPHGTLQLAL